MKAFVYLAVIILLPLMLIACGQVPLVSESGIPSPLKDIPSVRLNYVYEADVPPPEIARPAVAELVNPLVQTHFQTTRPTENITRTIPSPDGKRLLAIYQRIGDLADEFRLDMYSSEGKLLNKVTADTMAVHFPDTIVWSPNSSLLAFVAMIRGAQDDIGLDSLPDAEATADATPTPLPDSSADSYANLPELDANANPETNTAIPSDEPVGEPTPEAPTGILAFRTEQIYLCDADGKNTRPITQTEGLLYFYYVWSPDSTMLASLAATSREWSYLSNRAKNNSEAFIPIGRPRIVEVSGRERRLDDGLTAVRPVWSPDSAKVAIGFEHQVRIYDATGNTPTQAAVPLRNSLLLSSQDFDRGQQQALNAETSPEANTQAANPQSADMLPDPAKLASFNPIVGLEWQEGHILYFQTAYIRRMLNDADSVTSFARWHRLILSAQPPQIQ